MQRLYFQSPAQKIFPGQISSIVSFLRRFPRAGSRRYSQRDLCVPESEGLSRYPERSAGIPPIDSRPNLGGTRQTFSESSRTRSSATIICHSAESEVASCAQLIGVGFVSTTLTADS